MNPLLQFSANSQRLLLVAHIASYRHVWFQNYIYIYTYCHFLAYPGLGWTTQQMFENLDFHVFWSNNNCLFFQPHLLVQMKIHISSCSAAHPQRNAEAAKMNATSLRHRRPSMALCFLRHGHFARGWKEFFFAAAGGGRGGGDAETISFYSGRVFLGIVTMLFPTSLKSKGIMPLQVLSPGFLWIFDMESVLSGLVLSWFEATFYCNGNHGTSWDQLPRSCMMYIYI